MASYDSSFMDSVRAAMDEINGILNKRSLTLSEAEKIANRHQVGLHRLMSEIGTFHHIDYIKGVISK
jgi:hypothetical protein